MGAQHLFESWCAHFAWLEYERQRGCGHRRKPRAETRKQKQKQKCTDSFNGILGCFVKLTERMGEWEEIYVHLCKQINICLNYFFYIPFNICIIATSITIAEVHTSFRNLPKPLWLQRKTKDVQFIRTFLIHKLMLTFPISIKRKVNTEIQIKSNAATLRKY